MSTVDMRFPMDRVAIAGKCVTENLGLMSAFVFDWLEEVFAAATKGTV
jgi:hypothetical protein